MSKDYDKLTKQEIYQLYLNSKKRGFNNSEEFFDAQEMGINKYNDFKKFINSEFSKSDNSYYYSDKPTKEDYDNYLEFIKGKFIDKEQYEKAKELGFININIYTDFINSNCKTKDEYDFIKKKLPRIIKSIDKKLSLIKSDAESSFNKQNYEECIRLYHLLLEKTVEKIYLKTKKTQIPKNTPLYSLIEQISKQTTIDLLDNNEFNKWNSLRNKIVHQHFKIDKKTCEKGKTYFKNLITKLEEIK